MNDQGKVERRGCVPCLVGEEESESSGALLPRLVLVAAVYDGVLGIMFTFFYQPVFDMLGHLRQRAAIYRYGSFLFVIGVAYLIWRVIWPETGI
jgi:hypothetical protein